MVLRFGFPRSCPVVAGIETPWGVEEVRNIAERATSSYAPLEGLYVGGEVLHGDMRD